MIANLFASRVRGGEKEETSTSLSTSGGAIRELLLQIAYHLMTILLPVLAARYMYPIILPISRLENQLIEVGVAFQPVEPFVSSFKVSMLLVIIPAGIGGEW